MEAQKSTNFNEFYRSTGEHSINIRVEECFDKVLYHVNSRILKCKMKNVITMLSGLKISFKISNTDKCAETKKKHQIKLQVSKSHFRSQI
jgi:hypothetical protein